MRSFWDGKRVAVVGGSGFIGSHLVEQLADAGACVTATASSEATRLRHLEKVNADVACLVGDVSVPEHARRIVQGQEIVFYVAAKVGGVGYNVKHPGSLFCENLQPFLAVIEAVRLVRTPRVVITSSACVYPREASAPTPETEGFAGVPETTNSGYGWAKRMEEFVGQAYNEEFDLNVSIARPFNAYGPRDNFDPDKSHVIAALVRRVMSGENPLLVWGDGHATRSFLYVSDFVSGLMAVAEHSPQVAAINLGSDEEISIRDLAQMIVRLCGCDTQIIFDPSKPSGQPRRACDTGLARTLLGFVAQVPLEEGLARTIEWYRTLDSGRLS